MRSESTRFLGQPRLTNEKVPLISEFGFIGLGIPVFLANSEGATSKGGNQARDQPRRRLLD